MWGGKDGVIGNQPGDMLRSFRRRNIRPSLLLGRVKVLPRVIKGRFRANKNPHLVGHGFYNFFAI